MTVIKLTAKRQAPLPTALCEEMRLKPGDSLAVDARVVDGHRVWVMEPAANVKTHWYASLAKYAEGKRHDLDSIRESVREARRHGKL